MFDDVLWVDDDRFALQLGDWSFKSLGLQVIPIYQAADAEKAIDERPDVKVVILDVMMDHEPFSSFDAHAGFRTGFLLADHLKTKYPQITIIIYTAYPTDKIEHEFDKMRFRIFSKADMPARELAHEVRLLIDGQNRKPKSFIVHGHNDTLMLDLKNYLQNTLEFPEPLILREQPARGRTIIENFEENARRVDLVFVLLTLDDETISSEAANDHKRRARQNVIFELGYFYSALRRKRGRVILLHQGACELPSDISGIIYIDVSNGVMAAGEMIRREIGAALDW